LNPLKLGAGVQLEPVVPVLPSVSVEGLLVPLILVGFGFCAVTVVETWAKRHSN
jgi:hypothetical protein